jgi:2-oxoglutarate dehydrogenase E2 component (dihydrolipoamide succinyltransferase)
LVTSGEILARIDTDGKAAAAPAAAAAAPISASAPAAAAPVAADASASAAGIASPAASKILAEKGVAAASVAGTGRDGRITKGDALGASAAAAAPIAAPKVALANPTVPMTQSLDGRPEQRVPMSRLRARVAERLLQSQQDNAILTTFNEVNMQGVIDLRNLYKDKFEKEHGVKLGFMSFFVKAAVAALKRYPILNASVDGKDIIYHGYFDIGIAVGSPRGLVVPILRNADQLTIAEIEKTIADFGKRASEGKLGIEEMTGGTFSISNGGVFGSMLSTPIINPPQAAILGVHATKERAVVEKGQIVIRPINYLAMSYDHRIIDGREAVLGLVAMKEALEDPQRMLLEI